jgi:hypothetical protein
MNSRPITQAEKVQQLQWNVSYLRGLVIAREALNSQPLELENAIITKEQASFKAKFTDGRILQVVISKISTSESALTVQPGPNLVDQNDARRILLLIAQYSKANR